MQSHIREVYACLAVTCNPHFWQNDRGLLRDTEITRGWNEYRNKNQHRKLSLEKKILPPLLQGLEPATFRSLVRRSNHRAIPAPKVVSLLAIFLLISCSEPLWALPLDRSSPHWRNNIGERHWAWESSQVLVLFHSKKTWVPHTNYKQANRETIATCTKDSQVKRAQ